jgi:hypothetical protein
MLLQIFADAPKMLNEVDAKRHEFISAANT